MLFNSYLFLFAFLPAAVLLFYALNRHSRTAALAGLFLLSLVYYGHWNYRYIPLLLASIAVNFALGTRIHAWSAAGRGRAARLLLGAGIAGNLALLGYYKYANFFLEVAGAASGAAVVLPLAISFYTFQQIAYLVDAYRGNVGREGFLSYAVFVTFFPHLIAGPILHHREMIPQFAAESGRRLRLEDLSVGLAIFCIGLAKKVLLADPLSAYASPAFDLAATGAAPDFYAAWCGALAYTFQLYFDFSGYSDMAIGAARMLGIRLPLNFFSPYRATSIIEFWRRWHMTLSRLLRDYLYVPLGGNRKGPARRYVNLMLTMLLGGLWHGAGWTFIVWGGLHGLYLALNHGWIALRRRLGWQAPAGGAALLASRLLTFLAVVVAWVFFRAESLPAALRVLASMSGANGLSLPARLVSPESAAAMGATVSALPAGPLIACLLLLLACWYAPNTWQLMKAHDSALLPKNFKDDPAAIAAAWRPSPAWAGALAALFIGALVAMLSGRSEFLYYQF